MTKGSPPRRHADRHVPDTRRAILAITQAGILGRTCAYACAPIIAPPCNRWIPTVDHHSGDLSPHTAEAISIGLERIQRGTPLHWCLHNGSPNDPNSCLRKKSGNISSHRTILIHRARQCRPSGHPKESQKSEAGSVLATVQHLRIKHQHFGLSDVEWRRKVRLTLIGGIKAPRLKREQIKNGSLLSLSSGSFKWWYWCQLRAVTERRRRNPWTCCWIAFKPHFRKRLTVIETPVLNHCNAERDRDRLQR